MSPPHPNIEVFKKRISFKPSQVYRAYVRDAESNCFHEFKRVEEDLFFDDAGSEMELDGEGLLNEFMKFLNEGYEIQISLVHGNDNWQNVIPSILKGLKPLHYIILYPKNFSDLLVPSGESVELGQVDETSNQPYRSKIYRDFSSFEKTLKHSTQILHPRFNEFKRRLSRMFNLSKLFNARVFKADGTCVHNFKRVELDYPDFFIDIYLFDDVVSNQEINSYQLLNNFISYLTEGLQIQLDLRIYPGVENWMILPPEDFLDITDDSMSEIDREIYSIKNAKLWNSRQRYDMFTKFISMIKGTDVLKERFSDFTSIIENWQESSVRLKDNIINGDINRKDLVFSKLVDATKEARLLNEKLEDLFLLVENWSDDDVLSAFTILIKRIIEDEELIDENYSRIESLFSKILAIVEGMPGGEEKRQNYFSLVNTIKETKLLQRFKSRIEPVIEKNLKSIGRRKPSIGKLQEFIWLIRRFRNSDLMETFYSQIQSLFLEILTFTESDLDRVISFSPTLSNNAYSNKHHNFTFLINETKDTKLFVENVARIKPLFFKLMVSIKEMPFKGPSGETFNKDSEFEKMLQLIKGTVFVKEYNSHIKLICVQILNEMQRILDPLQEDPSIYTKLFSSFINAVKGTELLEEFQSRIELIFIQLLAKMERVLEDEKKVFYYDLQFNRLINSVKGTDLLEKYHSSIEQLFSKFLAALEQLPYNEQAKKVVSELHRGVNGIGWMEEKINNLVTKYDSYNSYFTSKLTENSSLDKDSLAQILAETKACFSEYIGKYGRSNAFSYDGQIIWKLIQWMWLNKRGTLQKYFQLTEFLNLHTEYKQLQEKNHKDNGNITLSYIKWIYRKISKVDSSEKIKFFLHFPMDD